MTSFSSELGVKFEASLEAPHVIDIDSQVWATSLLSILKVDDLVMLMSVY
jgi:Fanconi anemia group J protein